MIRKMLVVAIAIVALMASALALNASDASAHDACTYSHVIVPGNDCAPAIPYPGPFTNMPSVPDGPYGFWGVNAVAAAPVAAAPVAATGTGGGLAVTGSESTVLGYVGTGLIAFGAVAMGSRRKFFQGALD